MNLNEMLNRFERARILNEQRHMREALVSLTHAKPAPARENRFHRLFQFLIQFELMAKSLYRLRAADDQSALRRDTEDLVAGAARDLLGFQAEQQRTAPSDHWIYRYRQVWRDNLSLFLYTLAMFVVAAIVGWHIGSGDYAYASLFMPQPLIEQILDHHKWFEHIQQAPIMHGFAIAANNIRVAIYCFVLGALGGLGGVYILVFNGLFFGVIIGFCQRHGFHEALLEFVVSHGVLELTLIVAAAFSGFIFGRVFYMRPYRLFKIRMAAAARDAATLLLGLLPCLGAAACLEVFVSPWPFIAYQSKMLIGLAAAGAFWLWTFWPLPQACKDSRKRA